MKDIKSYVIGFLTCACLFLIMGQTSGGRIGKYQLVMDKVAYGYYFYVMDTETAELYHTNNGGKKGWKEYRKILKVKPLN